MSLGESLVHGQSQGMKWKNKSFCYQSTYQIFIQRAIRTITNNRLRFNIIKSHQRVIWGKYNIGFEIPIKFQSQRKKIFKLVHKQGNYALIKNAKIVMFKWTFVVQRVIWGKYNIGFGIHIKFPNKRKLIIEIGQETSNLCFN